KYRGNIVDRRVDYIKDSLHTPENIDKSRAFITHSGGLDDAEIENLVKVAKETIGFEEVLVTRAGCVISAHCGPGCMGILFIREK
ncbi:MAG: DegV family protein, partial [Clostridia bacterium]|nr:DegV family protein [Clostridia bacterium]